MCAKIEGQILSNVERHKIFRERLRQGLPQIPSQHLAEAIAFGYGLKTNSKVFADLINQDEGGIPGFDERDFDFLQFITRLGELGYTIDNAKLKALEISFDTFHRERQLQERAHVIEESNSIHSSVPMIEYLISAGEYEKAANSLTHFIPISTELEKNVIFKLLEKIGDKSYVAQINLATMLLLGDGTRIDIERGTKMILLLAQTHNHEMSGFPSSILGHIAGGNFGCKPNFAEALKHFEQAAVLGHAESAFNAGLYYLQGRPGIPVSPDDAKRCFSRGAVLGHAPSRTNLALHFYKNDPAQMIELLDSAAQSGDTMADALLDALTARSLKDAEKTVVNPMNSQLVPPRTAVFIPKSLHRPNEAVHAIKLKSATTKDAEAIIANMHGFATWTDLKRAICKLPPSLPDEECSQEERQKRFDYQLWTIQITTEMTVNECAEVVKGLKISSEKGHPKLPRHFIFNNARTPQALGQFFDWLDDEYEDDF
jgi:TPR repeat protein